MPSLMLVPIAVSEELKQTDRIALCIPYLLDCKPRLIKFFFPSCLRLKFKGGLHSRAVYIFFCLANISDVIVAATPNGWMNDNLTAD